MGIPPSAVQLLADPTPTESDQTYIPFRLAFTTPPREPAEGLLSALMGRFSAGSAGGIMNAPVSSPNRPPLNMVSSRLCLAKTTNNIAKTLSAVMNRLHETDFWLRHARHYYKNLEKYKRKRWKGTESACAQLLTTNAKVLLSGYYRKLSRHVQVAKKKRARDRALKYLASQTDSGLVRIYHKKAVDWVRTVLEAKKKALRRERAVKYLQRSTSDGLRRVYHRKCLNWLIEAKNGKAKPARGKTGAGAAENLLLTTNKGVRSRCWRKWKAFTKTKRTKRHAVDALAGVNKKVLMMKYFTKLAAFWKARAVRKTKLTAVDALALLNSKVLMAKYYRKLHRFAKAIGKLRRRRMLQNKLVGELFGKSVKTLARRAFKKLENYARSKAREREKEVLGKISGLVEQVRNGDGEKYEEIVKKCEALGTQVDVGLKTLTNTNSVLNKLVDRLISVDEQLDHLDRDKVSRKELGNIGNHTPLSDTAKTRPPPFREINGNVNQHKNISPPRMHGARFNATDTDKETEQWRLLQKEKARLIELTQQSSASTTINMNTGGMSGPSAGSPAPARWESYATGVTSSQTHSSHQLPSTEDTLTRARQWQRDRANLTPVRSDTTGVGGVPPGWKIT
eukprot:TRINITY_DN10763_c1_g1_i1.p1 TRINITY_DN10763_c1_g1~~TRINITY_DN10763_c1_g1_i1.p1  ORF type:complete len:678 (+),score=122.76 TRINITY_DN10763_c1_g1_i1:169-2034(+)